MYILFIADFTYEIENILKWVPSQWNLPDNFPNSNSQRLKYSFARYSSTLSLLHGCWCILIKGSGVNCTKVQCDSVSPNLSPVSTWPPPANPGKQRSVHLTHDRFVPSHPQYFPQTLQIPGRNSMEKPSTEQCTEEAKLYCTHLLCTLDWKVCIVHCTLSNVSRKWEQ